MEREEGKKNIMEIECRDALRSSSGGASFCAAISILDKDEMNKKKGKKYKIAKSGRSTAEGKFLGELE